MVHLLSGMWVAHFINDNVETFVYYSTRGIYEFMVRNYKEDRLHAEVRHLVKTNYHDYAIYHAVPHAINGEDGIQHKTPPFGSFRIFAACIFYE